MEPPLSFYGNSVVEKDGRYGETLDLEGRGLAFFVDFARVMSLKYGIRETNTNPTITFTPMIFRISKNRH